MSSVFHCYVQRIIYTFTQLLKRFVSQQVSTSNVTETLIAIGANDAIAHIIYISVYVVVYVYVGLDPYLALLAPKANVCFL